MSYWMSDKQKNDLPVLLNTRYEYSSANQKDILRARMDLEASEAQTRAAASEQKAAVASEKAAEATIRNARYMLWSVMAAASVGWAKARSAVPTRSFAEAAG